MIDHTTALNCITDDLLKAAGHTDDSRCELTDSEVMTTALCAALHCDGKLERARKLTKETGLMPRMLSKSRLCPRLHRLKGLPYSLFHQLGEVFKQMSPSTHYRLDSFPVPVCDNTRISRPRLVTGEEFRGHSASKRRYFHGVRVEVTTAADDIPEEPAFLPGEASAVRGLDVLPLTMASCSK